MTEQEQVAAVAGKRFRARLTCVCTPAERSNGWGCCCSWPLEVVEDSAGPLVVVSAEDYERIQTALS